MKLGKQSKKIAILTTLLILVGIAVVVIMAIANPTQNTHEIRLNVSSATASSPGGYIILEVEMARLPYADSINIGMANFSIDILYDETRFVPVRHTYPAGNPAAITMTRTEFYGDDGWPVNATLTNQHRPGGQNGRLRIDTEVQGMGAVSMSDGSIFIRFNVIDGAPIGDAVFGWYAFYEPPTRGGMVGFPPPHAHLAARLPLAGAANTATVGVQGAQRTVTFNPTGGSFADGENGIRTTGHGSPLPDIPANPTRGDGYTFRHWSLAQDGPDNFNPAANVYSNFEVFAVWNDPAIVTFNANLAGATPASQTRAVAPGTAIGAAQMPGNPSHATSVFASWNTSPDGTGDAFTGSSVVPQSMPVYAQWRTPVTVTFNAGPGGTLAPNGATRTVFSGESLGGNMPGNPSHPTELFAGWQLPNGQPFNSGTIINENIAVTAIWSATGTPVTVTFNAGTGALAPGGESRTLLQGMSLGADMPPNPSHATEVFVGWFDSSNQRFTGDTIVNSDMTVTAQFQSAAASLIITFDANGGVFLSGGNTRQVVAGNSLGTDMIRTPFHPNGDAFEGWNTESDGSGNWFTAACIVNQSKTVYAIWAQGLVVTFNPNQGDLPLTDTTRGVLAGRSLGLAMPSIPTRSGHTFVGWFTAISGGTEFTGHTSVMQSIEVFARWEVATTNWTVTFNANGGQLAANGGSRTVANGQALGNEMPNDPQRDNHTFDGWSLSQDGPDEFNSQTPVAGNITVFARWIADGNGNNQVVVTFNANGGTLANNGTSRTVNAGSAIGLANMPGNPTHSSDLFTHWEDAQGNLFDHTTIVNANITVYAQWGSSANAVTVTFNGNQGAPASVTRQVVAGFPVGAQMPIAPTRSGYTFDGWSTNAAGPVNFTAITEVNSDITVYAQWVLADNVTVIFNANNGTFTGAATTAEVVVARGQSIGDGNMPAPPTRSGHNFVGWSTTATGTVNFTHENVVNPTDSNIMHVYAVWTGGGQVVNNNVTVTFHANGGAFAANASTVTRTVLRGQSLGNDIPAQPTRSGFNFMGWSTSASGSVNFFSTTNVNPSGNNLNVFARWSEIGGGTGGGGTGGGSATPPTPPAPRPPAGTTQPPASNDQDDHDDQPGPGAADGLTAPPSPGDRIHQAFMVGFPDGTVRPHANVTRAEVATIIFRLTPDSERTSAWSQVNPFPDVQRNNWFNNAVSTMTNAGVFSGMPDGTFQPNRAITRAEFAVAMARHFGIRPAGGANMFTDISGHWAAREINALARAGMISGRSAGIFAPNESITRAEAAALVTRMLGRQFSSAGSLLPDMQTWSDNMNQNSWFYIYVQDATNSNHYVRNANGTITWTSLAPSRDWRVLEREYSRPTDIIGR